MADEWEESYVYMELAGVPVGNLCPPEQGSLEVQLLGLTSDRPALQLSGHSFSGHCEDVIGTSLFFQHDQHPESDRGPQKEARTEFVCKSSKKIIMQPVIFVEKSVDLQPTTMAAHSQRTTLAPSLMVDHSEPCLLVDHSEPTILADHSEPTILADHSEPTILAVYSEPNTLTADGQPSHSAAVTDVSCEGEQPMEEASMAAFGDNVNNSLTCSEKS